jgi:L-aspartate semialdehyde sulfurtransferase ferredoxin
MASKRIVLKFPHRLIEKPIICDLVRKYNLEFSILKAYVTPREEGLLVLELTGSDEDYKKGLEYLKKSGVTVQALSQDVIRNEQRCTDCGACVTICPVGALVLDNLTRRVHFYDNKCIACELCVKVCPVKAMEVHF